MRAQILVGMAFLFAWDFTALASAAVEGGSYERSILNLSATRAVPDAEAPWNILNSDVSGIVGVVVGPNRVLAPASLISRAVYIQAQRLDDVAKVPMKVLFADYEANLALLAPQDGELQGVVPLAVGDEMALNTEAWFFAMENEKQLQRFSVKVLEVAMRDVIVGGMQLPAYVLTGQNRSQCRGEPLIRSQKLIGICLGSNDNQPWAITATTIKHFLNDRLEEEHYRGFPILGMGLSIVRSPFLKQQIHWPKGITGLRISKIQETSAFADDVKVNDVLWSVDEHKVDNRGFTKHPLWSSVPLRYYLSSRYAGDKLTLKVYRNGKALEFTRPLRRYNGQDLLVPGATFEGGMPHLIIGGLVFRELGVDFLSSFGKDWPRFGPTHLIYQYQYGNSSFFTRKREIILSHVLADPFNQGYDKESLLFLDKINGASVANLDELRLAAEHRAVEKDGDKYLVFEFRMGPQVVLPMKGLKSAHERIARAYSVTTPSSFLTSTSSRE